MIIWIGLLTVVSWLCSFCSLDFRTLHDHCHATLRIMIHKQYFKLSCTLLALRDLTVVYHYVWDHLLNFYYTSGSYIATQIYF